MQEQEITFDPLFVLVAEMPCNVSVPCDTVRICILAVLVGVFRGDSYSHLSEVLVMTSHAIRVIASKLVIAFNERLCSRSIAVGTYLPRSTPLVSSDWWNAFLCVSNLLPCRANFGYIELIG